jgi:preprotein translocase subunit SecB
MADEGNIISDLNFDSDTFAEDTSPAAGIISQYIKDLSVENPNAPQSFQWQDTPQIDVQFNIGATPVEGEVHEVELKIVVTSRADAGVAFAIDLSYCALVGMRNLADAQAHAFLFAEAPRILFPFARAIISEAVRDAGYAPLMLEPIDFNGLYTQQLSAQQGVGEPAGNA